jgi:hypothetical protein
VERAEVQLGTLGAHRPIGVIKAELASSMVASQIWRRSRQCTELALEESRTACAPVLGLRKELAAAESAEHLETQLVAGRTQLATMPVVGPSADPQAGALARFTGLDETTIRTFVALLLAGIIEAGSALGFTLVTVATSSNTPPLKPSNPPGSKRSTPPPAAPTNAPGPKTAPRRYSNPPRPATTDALERWVQTRLKVDPAAEIPAREAYTAFCFWSRAEGLEPGTETRFGRDFTARIGELGGQKVKRRDRAYYIGASLVEGKIPLSLKAAA